MKYICTLLLTMASLFGAEPPKLLSLSVTNDQCSLTWSHPSAKKFEIIWASPDLLTGNWRSSFMPTPGMKSWTFPVDSRVNFECAVRGVSAGTTNVTEWSNGLKYDSDDLKGLPPDPLDKRRWSQSAASTLGTFTSSVSEKDLVMTWGFNASIEPGFDFQVYESSNLKDWKVVARIPLATNAGFNIPKAPYGFYKVAVVHQLSGTVHWNAITNLFMDP